MNTAGDRRLHGASSAELELRSVARHAPQMRARRRRRARSTDRRCRPWQTPATPGVPAQASVARVEVGVRTRAHAWRRRRSSQVRLLEHGRLRASTPRRRPQPAAFGTCGVRVHVRTPAAGERHRRRGCSAIARWISSASPMSRCGSQPGCTTSRSAGIASPTGSSTSATPVTDSMRVDRTAVRPERAMRGAQDPLRRDHRAGAARRLRPGRRRRPRPSREQERDRWPVRDRASRRRRCSRRRRARRRPPRRRAEDQRRARATGRCGTSHTIAIDASAARGATGRHGPVRPARQLAPASFANAS